MKGRTKGQAQSLHNQVQTLHRLLDMGLVKDFSTAIDGGSHIGTWTVVMAEHFKRVLAFEPTPETFGYLCQNLAEMPNVQTINAALMDVPGLVMVLKPAWRQRALTSRYAWKTKVGNIPCVAIDGLDLDSCGLIKLDLEGAEELALRGAVNTITRFSPVLVVEIGGLSVRFGHDPEEIHQRILKMGYREVMRAHVDRVYVK